MPRKTTILIIILAVITGVLIFLAVKSDTIKNPLSMPEVITPSPSAILPYATLTFSKDSFDISTLSATQTIDILINSGNKPVAGAQVELTYDPKVFTNVKLIPADQPFFGKDSVVLINAVDPTQGRISYAVGISEDGQEKVGQGTLVRLNFTANKFAGVSQSTINFLSKSAVTTLQSRGSVLKYSIPLLVTLSTPKPSIPTAPVNQ